MVGSDGVKVSDRVIGDLILCYDIKHLTKNSALDVLSACTQLYKGKRVEMTQKKLH